MLKDALQQGLGMQLAFVAETMASTISRILSR